jgi:hypothetical protein
MMTMSILLAMLLWGVRERLSVVRWCAVVAMVVLNVIMNDPVYFLMARIDITGGSTGWHRAALIRASIEHVGEWWLAGTDYTRHWMASGISANEAHTDITNHLLYLGVMGGLPLVLLFVALLVIAFGAIGRALESEARRFAEHRFLSWTLGAMLFGHVINFLGISLFDQSVVFLWAILAAIGSIESLRSRGDGDHAGSAGRELVTDTRAKAV